MQFKKDVVSNNQNRRRAQSLRGDKCEICGAKENLHAHHKDRNIANNTKDNIQTLCVYCHNKTHFEENHFQKTCLICGKVDKHRIRKGYCNKHYLRFKRTGSPLIVRIGGKKKTFCRICGDPSEAKQLCNKHYLRMRNNGDPRIIKKQHSWNVFLPVIVDE